MTPTPKPRQNATATAPPSTKGEKYLEYVRSLTVSGVNLGGPLDKRLTMWYTTRVEFNDTRIAATL